MTLFLLLGCGSGQQSVDSSNGGGADTGGSSLSSVLMDLGRSAENAFYSFLELLSDTLGFTAKLTTKKEDVGGYFNSLGAKIGEASDELEQVAKKSETELDKGDLNKIIRSAVDSAKATLSTLKTHLDSLGTIGDDKVVGWAENDQQGIKPADDGLNKFFNALQLIVKAATDAGVLAPKAGNTTLTVNGVDNKDGAKLLAIDKPGAAVGDKATLIVSAVSGEEMLASIVASKDSDQALGAAADGNTSAISFAKGGTAAHLAGANTPKAAAVAGGIALRSLVKDGKLASHNDNSEKAVQAAGVTAVNKLLVAVEDIIKKTVNNVLKTAKTKIDEARAPKPIGQ
ncbi:variable large family protein (plasmid) [Borrelia puertoricensis]|uniref:variable large family protein n=1 Tax=Borrelia puertoricensis TaxID=2756107 RepID=UPI003EBE6DB4